MADNTISPVPNNMPLADQQGMVSQIWSGFFNQLWARAGGSTASSNTSLQQQINSFVQSGPNSIKGNNTGSTTNAFDLTPAQVNAMLAVFSSTLKGLVPASGGGTTNFLRADGTWIAPSATVLDYFASSQVTTSSSTTASGSFVTASNSPAFTFTPNFTGNYRVYASIPTRIDDVTAAKGIVRIFKTSGAGTLLSESQALVAGVTSTVPLQASVAAQSVYSLTSGVSYVFDFQMALLSGTSILIDGLDSPFYIFAERVS